MTPPTERQSRVIWFALTGLAVGVIAALVAGLVWSLGQILEILAPFLWPLAVAGVLAYLLDPVVDFFERKGLPRTRAIIVVFVVALLIIAGLFTSIVPPIVSQTRQLVAHVPEISAKVEKRVSQLIDNPPPWVQKILKEEPAPAPAPAPVPADGASSSTNAPAGGGIDRETLHSASGWVANVLPRVGTVFGVVGRHVVGWFGILAGLALVPVYAFYLLVEKRGIESKWADYLPMGDSHFKSEVVFVVHQINNYLIAFFRGQVLVAICDGVLYTIGFLIVGVPYAVLLGAMSIALTMIPFLGAIVTCVAALVLSLAYHGDWLHPLLVLAVFGVVQTLEGLVISPKIMGNRVGLHPLTIIIAVMAGTTLLGGLLGGILAIPLTAVLRVLMARYVWTKRESSAS